MANIITKDPYSLTQGDVFYFAEDWFIFKRHRRVKAEATRLSDGRSFLVRVLQANEVRVDLEETAKQKEEIKNNQPKTVSPTNLQKDDLFVITRGRNKDKAELYRFSHSSGFNVHAINVITGMPVTMKNFQYIKIDNLPH